MFMIFKKKQKLAGFLQCLPQLTAVRKPDSGRSINSQPGQ
jgi:hypothetical protein|tara:strand:+ start:4349 stop:4468 length:120 start_codon:yes stop_codon:yes gene_type:complete